MNNSAPSASLGFIILKNNRKLNQIMKFERLVFGHVKQLDEIIFYWILTLF
jgi:hypothetical protein